MTGYRELISHYLRRIKQHFNTPHMSYTVQLKKTTQGTFRVCLVSSSNGKLVLQGESIKNRDDAEATRDSIAQTFNGPEKMVIGEDLKPHHKFPENSGPKKKAAKKAATAKKPAVKKASK
jgi:uncharacterized protein YegP (UPF0339 family)